ncbi:L,D-transpeptidase [Gryllotalpicola ginsengisoli]|uniref:L,D-transpeptidase n=1 Tax=Gryllotalpicola ginsengisoli TaxID=444608 RepID=UPI0012DDF10A|nr:L,D-transpeptidase [Gryllotalpicola ginsengisoli]
MRDGTMGDGVASVAAPAPTGTEAAHPTWVEVERPPRKKHLGLWFGIPGGLVVAAAVAASLILIAPGVTAAGASVGWMTQGAAQQAIADRLADAKITVGDATLTGSQLGASIDAKALAKKAIGEHPLWNVTAWNPDALEGAVTIDSHVALPALRKAAPELFSDARNAAVVFDQKTGKFTAQAAQSGTGVDLTALADSLSHALATTDGPITVTPKKTQVEAAATTAEAQAFADKLNDQAPGAGFYVDDTKSEALSLATVASWITISSDPATGAFTITPDQTAIAKSVEALPAKVNQDPVKEQDVVNSAGKVLRVIQAGQNGFTLSTSGLAGQIAGSLQSGNLHFDLQGQVTKFQTQTLFRRIEVDKSAGATYLYQGTKPGDEKKVATYPIAIGTGGEHETKDGHFTVYAQLRIQDMGDCNGGTKFGYCTKNVPWISYFDGDQGFHGTYWHNNFGPGARMSHGCVNMRIPDAEALYHFAQIGTEVWVHE